MNPACQPNNPPCAAPQSLTDRVIPTGSLALDRALGTGGWPRGRIVELYGGEGCGKTTLVYEAIASAQRNGGVAALIDADHGSSPDAAARVGADPGGLVLHRSNVLEDVFKTVEEFVKRNIDLIAIDSIAGILPGNAQKAGATHFVRTKDEEHQRQIEHCLKALLGPLSRSKSVLLITNQQREKIGVMYGDPNMTPWETHPLKDFASQRVEAKRITHILDKEEKVGYEARLRVIKNRLGPAFTVAEFEVYFATGIGRESELIPLGLSLDVLTKSGWHIRYGNLSLGRSEREVIARLRREPELAAEIREAIRGRFNVAPPEATEMWETKQLADGHPWARPENP